MILCNKFLELFSDTEITILSLKEKMHVILVSLTIFKAVEDLSLPSLKMICILSPL